MSDTLKYNSPIRLAHLAADPSSPEDGTMYYNTVDGKIKQFINNSWQEVSDGIIEFAGSPLNENEIIVGDNTNESAFVDTSATGDILADSSTGLTIKTGVIVDTDINSNADITRTKLAPGNAFRVLANDASGEISENAAITGNRAVASNANGQLVHSTTTATELGFVSGVTSSIQTQLDGKVDSVNGEEGIVVLDANDIDANWGGGIDSFTSLLLHLDGNITDSSTYANVGTDVNTLSYSSGKFGQAGDFTGGVAEFVTFPSLSPGGIFDFAGGDFTIDFWVKIPPGIQGPAYLIDRWGDGVPSVAEQNWILILGDGTVNPTNKVFFGPSDGAGSQVFTLISTNEVPDDGNFHHIAVVRDGNDWSLYIDGVLEDTVNNNTSIPFEPTTDIHIGSVDGTGANFPFRGYMDEIRISKGIARWTTDFTPPAVPYQLNILSVQQALDSLDTRVESLENNDADYVKANGTVPFTANQSMGGFKLTGLAAPTTNGDALRFDQLGANSGIATLDGGGKIPASQLPNTVMEYKGNWNASTNSPTLIDGTGNAGDVYRVSVAGTQDLGSGSISFSVGDWIVYNGSIWEKSINSNEVVSVNGQSGIVVLDTGDIAEDGNLYFTDERAQDAVGTILLDSSSVDFTYSDGTPSITAAVLPAGVDHDQLLNYNANDHVDHTSVQIATAANTSGLTGGGTIAATRNLSVDITGTTAETTADNADKILIFDNSATALKSMTRANFLSGIAVNSAGDLNEGSFTGLTNNTADQVITGFTFNNAVVRSFKAQVSIFLDATTDQYTSFDLMGIQKGASWEMSEVYTGDTISGFSFNITSLGQVRVSIGNIAGFSSAVIKFRATTTSV